MTTPERGDYEVTFKVRNGRMLRAMNAAGIASARALAILAGVSYHTVCKLLGCQTSALKPDGDFRDSVLAISAALHVEPEELFTQRQMTSALKRNRVTRFYDEADLDQLTSVSIKSLEQEVSDKQIVSKGLECLLPRERAVIEHLFYDEMTFDELAAEMKISRSRVGQLMLRALHKMRARLRSRVGVREWDGTGAIKAPAYRTVVVP